MKEREIKSKQKSESHIYILSFCLMSSDAKEHVYIYILSFYLMSSDAKEHIRDNL